MKQFTGRLILIVLLGVALGHLFVQDKDVFTLAEDVNQPPKRKDPGTPPKRGWSFKDIFSRSKDNNSSDGIGKITPEQKQLFEEIKSEIAICIKNDIPNANRRCPQTTRGSKNKVIIDKECAKEKKIEVGLRCEEKLLSRIPYRDRPAWQEYRSSKIEKEKAKLKQIQDKKKGHRVKKAGSASEADGRPWLKEF